MISKIQSSWRQFRDVTVIWNFQTSLETNICEARLSFRRPFTPNSFFASVLPRTDWMGAPKLTLSPGARNPRNATGYYSINEFALAFFFSIITWSEKNKQNSYSSVYSSFLSWGETLESKVIQHEQFQKSFEFSLCYWYDMLLKF